MATKVAIIYYSATALRINWHVQWNKAQAKRVRMFGFAKCVSSLRTKRARRIKDGLRIDLSRNMLRKPLLTTWPGPTQSSSEHRRDTACPRHN